MLDTEAIEKLSDVDMRMQVMFAEPLHSRTPGKGTPPLAPSQSLSVRSDSNSSILHHQRSLTGEFLSSFPLYFLSRVNARLLLR